MRNITSITYSACWSENVQVWKRQRGMTTPKEQKVQRRLPHSSGPTRCAYWLLALYCIVLSCLVLYGSDWIWISRWREQRVAVGYERETVKSRGRGGVVVVQYFCSVRRSALLCITIHISIHEACTDFKCHVDCWKSCLSIGLLSVPVPLSVHTVGLPKTWIKCRAGTPYP